MQPHVFVNQRKQVILHPMLRLTDISWVAFPISVIPVHSSPPNHLDLKRTSSMKSITAESRTLWTKWIKRSNKLCQRSNKLCQRPSNSSKVKEKVRARVKVRTTIRRMAKAKAKVKISLTINKTKTAKVVVRDKVIRIRMAANRVRMEIPTKTDFRSLMGKAMLLLNIMIHRTLHPMTVGVRTICLKIGRASCRERV